MLRVASSVFRRSRTLADREGTKTLEPNSISTRSCIIYVFYTAYIIISGLFIKLIVVLTSYRHEKTNIVQRFDYDTDDVRRVHMNREKIGRLGRTRNSPAYELVVTISRRLQIEYSTCHFV